MVEHIEVFCAYIELDAFGQAEAPAQREISFVDGEKAPQPIAGKVSCLSLGWSREGSGIQYLAPRLRGSCQPVRLPGDDVWLRLIWTNYRRDFADGHINRPRRGHTHKAVYGPPFRDGGADAAPGERWHFIGYRAGE